MVGNVEHSLFSAFIVLSPVYDDDLRHGKRNSFRPGFAYKGTGDKCGENLVFWLVDLGVVVFRERLLSLNRRSC
jgi:hypothetical protein